MPQMASTNSSNNEVNILYSRKFNGIGILPPDYSGVALRRAAQDTSEIPDPSPKTDFDTPPCHPRRPVFECDASEYESDSLHHQDHKESPFEEKHSPECKKSKSEGSQNAPLCSDEPQQSCTSKRNFSLEDIMLAGLLLLLMNDESTDNGLLIIVGLLLLVGM
jgi:hypothetical protein